MKEINIAESEWLYDVDNDMYYCTVEVTGNFEYFDVFVLAHPTKHVIEQIGEYVGNIEKEYTYRVFK